MGKSGRGDGRDRFGRFAAGNLGGPGRPSRATEAVYLGAVSEAVPVDVWRQVVERARDDALAGDKAARSWLSGLLLGKERVGLSDLARDDLLGVTPEDRVRVAALRVVDAALSGPLATLGPSDNELAVQVARAREAAEDAGAGEGGEPNYTK